MPKRPSEKIQSAHSVLPAGMGVPTSQLPRAARPLGQNVSRIDALASPAVGR